MLKKNEIIIIMASERGVDMTSIIRVNYVSHVSIRAKHCEYVSQLAVICCGNKCSRFHSIKKPMNDLTLKLNFFSNEFNCQYISQSLLLTKFKQFKT